MPRLAAALATLAVSAVLVVPASASAEPNTDGVNQAVQIMQQLTQMLNQLHEMQMTAIRNIP